MPHRVIRSSALLYRMRSPCIFPIGATSDYVVGEVWGRKGADFYLLDQVRDRLDFDRIVQAIKDLSRNGRTQQLRS